MAELQANTFTQGPDERGHFGAFGGRYVAETLMPLVLAVERAYGQAQADPAYRAELDDLLKHYVGRPSPLYFAERLTAHLGGARIYFKRDELNHTGAHKINHAIGQVLLARRMGKTRIIAETGAGQHGVATATVAARFGLPCTVFMGAVDMERQQPNVFRMRLLGAEVRPVTSGSATLKDAMNEALRDWVSTVDNTFYVIGTVAGPHPYPMMVRDFQSVIGREAREQIVEREGRLPDTLVACVGGGSNALGLFHPFLDADGQIVEAHSISAGLDYPGIGPEHAWLAEQGRVTYVSVTDQEALDAFQLLSRTEGIIPALEPAHALAHVIRIAPELPADHLIVMNLCGRGDKDIFTAAEALGVSL